MAKGIKTGGRQKGTPNKSTREIRSILSGILTKEIERIPKYLNEIDPEKKMQLLIKLLPYILPVYPDEQEEEIKKENGVSFIHRINSLITAQNKSEA